MLQPKDIFAALELDFKQQRKNVLTTQLITQKENDLEAPVHKLYPEINTFFSELNQYGKHCYDRLGSSIYLSFTDKIQQKCCKYLERKI